LQKFNVKARRGNDGIGKVDGKMSAEEKKIPAMMRLRRERHGGVR